MRETNEGPRKSVMSETTTNAESPVDPVALATRMGWLAYQASIPMGLGILHLTDKATEDDLRRCGRVESPGEAGWDYAYGRMMKLYMRVTPDGVTWPEHMNEAEEEYQSWACRYPTMQALHDAAVESLRAEVSQ